MIFITGRTLQAFNLQPSAPASTPAVISIPRGLTLDEVERLYIESSLRDQGGSVEGTARQLGISRKVLWQRRRKHGMSSPRGD